MTLLAIDDADFDWLATGAGNSRGLRVAPGGVERSATLPIVRRMVAALHSQRCAAAWMMVDGDEVVGLCSFRRPPRDGRAEIGYGVAETRRKRGFATQAVAQMIALAPTFGVRVVGAETARDNVASAVALERNGFIPVGERFDSEDGPVVRWERDLATAPGWTSGASRVFRAARPYEPV